MLHEKTPVNTLQGKVVVYRGGARREVGARRFLIGCAGIVDKFGTLFKC